MAARARGVFLSAGARFSVDGALERYLRVPFSAPADELRRAVDILADVWTDVRAAAPSASAARICIAPGEPSLSGAFSPSPR